MKLKAVTILEVLDGDVLSVHVYTDDPKGVLEAKELFTRIYMEHKTDVDAAEDEMIPTAADHEAIDDCIDGGVYDDDNGYQLIILPTTE